MLLTVEYRCCRRYPAADILVLLICCLFLSAIYVSVFVYIFLCSLHRVLLRLNCCC